jgi:hypothetical protein
MIPTRIRFLGDPRVEAAELAAVEAERAEKRGDLSEGARLYRVASRGFYAVALEVPDEQPNTKCDLLAAAECAGRLASGLLPMVSHPRGTAGCVDAAGGPCSIPCFCLDGRIACFARVTDLDRWDDDGGAP